MNRLPILGTVLCFLMCLVFADVAFADEPPVVGGPGAMCGGIAGLQCAPNAFCEFKSQTCGAADQSGSCAPMPEFCTREFRPVCGCDDKTYGNDCERRSAGVALLREGEC